MSTPDGLERRLTAWLEAQAPLHEPDGLLDAVSRDIAGSARVPGWAITERWLPMQTRARLGTVPRVAIILATVGLLAALLTSLVLAAGGSPAPPPELPVPWGLAGNGLIAHDGGGDIWVMEPDGSAPVQLTSGPQIDFEPSWSPDGRLIAFWSVDVPAYARQSSGDWGAAATAVRLAILDPVTGDRHDVVVEDKVEPRSRNIKEPIAPSWAPDSRSLVYGYVDNARKHDEPVMAIVSIDDLAPRRLAVGDYPVWSPQGTWIAYRGVPDPDVPGSSGVWIISPDGTGEHKVSQASGSGYAFEAPQWSMDERFLTFYVGPDSSHDVAVARTDGTEEWSIGNEPAQEYWPSFSPDGTRVAFQRDRPGESLAFNYVTTDPDGSNPIDVPSPLFLPGLPGVWAPDGTRILGIHQNEGRTIDLYEVDPAGVAEPILIPLAFDWVNVAWQRVAPARPVDHQAPEVRNGLIAFASSDGIETLDPNTGGSRVVVPGAADHGPGCRWRPCLVPGRKARRVHSVGHHRDAGDDHDHPG